MRVVAPPNYISANGFIVEPPFIVVKRWPYQKRWVGGGHTEKITSDWSYHGHKDHETRKWSYHSMATRIWFRPER